ncbi:MAG: hypothetical protein R3289_15090, partial [Photobacterium sp.]|nr:hypothetical protein [Photobacterium sp.]
WRFGNWLSLNHWAQSFMERHNETLPQAVLNTPKLVEWSKPLPKSQWVNPPKQLIHLNQLLEKEYAKGNKPHEIDLYAIYQQVEAKEKKRA